MIEKHIVLEDIDPVIFYGVNNVNMKMIQALYPKLKIVARGNVIKVLGDEEEMCAFEENILALEKHCAQYNSLKEEVILDIVKGRSPQIENTGDTIVFSVTGKPIVPRSENQLKLVQEYEKNDMLFAIGPAGSGKTYTAIALAVRSLKNKEIKKIILSRPAVEAGEKLGFLPGDMKDKIDPYLQPLYDALQDMIPAAKLKEYMELNVIQIAPLAFMRGRTLNDAVVILDEAQNTTTQQIKMFLTRMGMNTKMIVTGDMTQIDLPSSQTSGLIQALKILKGVKGISFIELNKKDIVRHKLVTRIVEAYEKFEEKQKTELHEKYGILVDALEAAGYRYDYRESEPGHIVLAPDGTHEIAGYLQFESWGDIKDWLEDTIAEGTDISERVDRAMYPFKYDYTLEEEMFRGNGDRYAIYHVDEDTPGKQHLFMNMAMVKEDGITIDAANYKCVYSGRLHENEKLDDLYAVFNDNPPADYKAHSMSVSDVIITNRGGDMQAYYVDRFGFAELPDFAAQREKILDIVPEIENVDYENDLTCISFYAAECAEFPVMGEVHYDLTLPEALEAYEKIPSERMHGLKCVGFDLKDGSDYEGMQSLMIEGKIQKEFLNSIPGFRENSYVQNAISRVEKYLEERHPNVENPLESNKKVDNEKNISEEKNEKELNIQMKPIPKKKRGEMSL